MAAILIRIVFLLHLLNCATKFIIIYTRLEWRKREKCSSALMYAFHYIMHVSLILWKMMQTNTFAYFTTHNLQLHIPNDGEQKR